MEFWTTSLRIFHALCDTATQSMRPLARQTGLSKSRGHRLTQAIARRDHSPASWGWETEHGRRGRMRLGVAARSPFRLKRGVGLETSREFVTPRPLEPPGGGAPAAFGGVRRAWEAAMREPTAAWEPDGVTTGARRESSGAVDATFLPRLLVGGMDRVSGSLWCEEVAEDRP